MRPDCSLPLYAFVVPCSTLRRHWVYLRIYCIINLVPKSSGGMTTIKGMTVMEQMCTLRKGSTDESRRDTHTVLRPDPMYRLRNGVDPRGLARIQSSKTGLNCLENLFLRVQLRQRGCIWSQKRVLKYQRAIQRTFSHFRSRVPRSRPCHRSWSSLAA